MDRRRFSIGLAGICAATIVGRASDARAAGLSDAGAFAFRFDGIDGAPLALSRFRGRVLVVVNTASHCGFTNQYRPLQALWDRYRDRGLTIIGVPSNDFGGQEPGDNSEIKGFCSSTYGITFPLAGKAGVRGTGAHPFYRWAAEALGQGNAPRWNFHKYLVGRDGRLVAAFASSTEPNDPRVVAAIEAALAKPAP